MSQIIDPNKTGISITTAVSICAIMLSIAGLYFGLSSKIDGLVTQGDLKVALKENNENLITLIDTKIQLAVAQKKND